MEEYQYPLDLEWTTAEMVKVVKMWEILEKSYEQNVTVEQFLAAYQEFKTVVRSIGEERKLGREFEAASGYSLYHAVKHAKALQTGKFSMKGVRR
ncbi:UPF0223 family protein [Enterococcus bulliens]